jgi:hypothetical protein
MAVDNNEEGNNVAYVLSTLQGDIYPVILKIIYTDNGFGVEAMRIDNVKLSGTSFVHSVQGGHFIIAG